MGGGKDLVEKGGVLPTGAGPREFAEGNRAGQMNNNRNWGPDESVSHPAFALQQI